MPENMILQKDTRVSTKSLGTASTELGDLGQLEAPAPRRGDQLGGRLKKIGLKVAAVVFDNLEQMEW